MFSRSITDVALTGGLILAVGMGTGCQTPQVFRSDKHLSSYPATRAQNPRPRDFDEGSDRHDQSPETTTEPRFPFWTESEPATTVVPESRPLPAPSADEFEALRPRPRPEWTPARPNDATSEVSQLQPLGRSNETDDSGLPPARVTYNDNTPENSAGEPYQATTISRPQPRLFRPAGTAKNMFETMKRKLP
jgi:hypothetical protein